MILIPSVSLGNVPQLAIDLLTYSYGFEIVKSLDDTYLSPFIGPMDYKPSDVCVPPGIATACQLYKFNDIYLVQIRSPPHTGCNTKFVESLHTELRDLNEKVIIVGSAFAGNAESGMQGKITESNNSSRLPESGFVSEALKEFENSTSLVSWVHEGDNTQDAINLANALIQKCGLKPKELVQPVSWLKMYGKGAPLGAENGLYS